MKINAFKYPLKKMGLHVDFLRLRCGAEGTFQDGIRSLKSSTNEAPRVFIAFAEWDAVAILPCTRLYPPGLNRFYGTPEVAASISGNAGYFCYMWDHPINDGLEEKLSRFETSGVGTLISLRFEDWIRNKLGLAAEMLLTDELQKQLQRPENEGIDAVVAHTLGWNDVAILLHASTNEQRLTELLSWLRIVTVGSFVSSGASGIDEVESNQPIFAASYTHLIGSYDQYHGGELSLGALCDEIVAAKLLVRVPASFEPEVRRFIDPNLPVAVPPKTLLEKMPSEMGHYSFSVNVTELAKENGGANVFNLIRQTRAEIGRMGVGRGGSYAETSTIFTFVERQEGIDTLVKPLMSDDIKKEIEDIALVLQNLPQDLQIRGASPMTIHRFATVLVTLIDHLSDPVRSSAVRHAATFLRTLPDRIGGLSRESIDDLCHVCETAMGQAIDGIAQFQHDANSIGLTGRGGYSRLIGSIEMFARDLFVALGVKEETPLITFGLRTGTPGSLDRFQIDIPFRVVFTPSDWYILLHEVGHHCWIESFGWMTESLATYDALSREILLNRPDAADPDWEKIDKATRAEFISARSIIRELFPNLLVYRLACGDDIERFDELSMHHVLRAASKNDGMRSMLIAVVLHCLLEAIGNREEPAGARTTPPDLKRARSWWQGWAGWRDELRANPKEKTKHQLGLIAQRAIDSVSKVLARRAEADIPDVSANNKQKILNSDAFLDAVIAALTSVIEVLASSGQNFTLEDSPDAARLFDDVQVAIDTAVDDQEKHIDWRRYFGPLLVSGEVLALIPPGHVWLWLLLDADPLLRPRSSPEFMVSQLSIVLSMWHRAVTARPSGDAMEAIDRLENVIKTLGYIETVPRVRNAR